MIAKKGREFPFGSSLLSDFFDGDRFFGKDFLMPDKVPAANVSEQEKAFVIELAVPGLKKDDFNVSVNNGLLTISAEKEEESNVEKENYTRKEFNFSSFRRTFSLPENVKEDEIEALYSDGLLKLMLPKMEVAESKSKQIEIR